MANLQMMNNATIKTVAKSNNSISSKQKRFVIEYCKDWNATAAAKRAGYPAASAHNAGHRLLRRPAVRAAIRERQDRVAQAALLDEVEIVRGLLREARYQGEGSSHAARVSAWKELAKIRGLEVSRVEHTVDVRLDGRLAQARQRAQLIEAQAQALPAPGNAVDMPASQKAETAPATEGVIEAEIIEDMPAARGESEPIPGGATGRA